MRRDDPATLPATIEDARRLRAQLRHAGGEVLAQAINRLQLEAVAALHVAGDVDRAIFTEVGSRSVMVAVATHGAVGVVQVPRDQYDGARLLAMIGVVLPASTPPDVEQLRKEHAIAKRHR